MKNFTKILLAIGGTALALVSAPGPAQDLYVAWVSGHPKVAGVIGVISTVAALLHNPKQPPAIEPSK